MADHPHYATLKGTHATFIAANRLLETQPLQAPIEAPLYCGCSCGQQSVMSLCNRVLAFLHKFSCKPAARPCIGGLAMGS
jgi:hypothetical protein